MKGYGEYKGACLPWLNKIPAHWKIQRGKQLFVSINARSESGTQELLSVSAAHGVVKRKNTNVTMFQASSYTGYKLCWPDDLVINSLWAWQQGLGFSRYHGIISKAYSVFRLRNTEVSNHRYYNYFIRGVDYLWELHVRSKGIWRSRYQLSDDDFLRSPMISPPREEQDQIVRYLDAKVSKINKLIKIKQQQILLLKECIYSELYALIICSKETISLKRLVLLESSFVEIEEDKTYSKVGMYNRGRGIFSRPPVLGKDMGSSKFQKISEGMLLISGQFAWEGSVAITSKKDEKSVASHRYYLLSVKKSSVTIEYIWSYLTSRDGIELLNRCSHGAAGRNKPLNIKELLRASIPMPPLANHKKIKHLVCRLESFVEQTNSVITALTEYRTRLISDVVTGKVDVRHISISDADILPEMEADVTLEDESYDSDIIAEEQQ